MVSQLRDKKAHLILFFYHGVETDAHMSMFL